MSNKNLFEEVAIKLHQRYLDDKINCREDSQRTKLDLMIGILIQINAEFREHEQPPTTLSIIDLCKVSNYAFTVRELTSIVINDLKSTYWGDFSEVFGEFVLADSTEKADPGILFVVITTDADR